LGGSFTAAERQQLMMELMNLDYEERLRRNEAVLDGSVISQYHDRAFSIVFPNQPRAPEAWTAYHLVRIYDDNVFLQGDSYDDYSSMR
jgi:hypothetical protein